MAAAQVYIGVDPTAGKGLFAYAMLDERLNVVAAEDTDIDGLLQVAGQYPRVACAIGAPGGPNKGLMAESAYRQRLGLPPDSKTYSTFRVCEYELRRRKIGLPPRSRGPGPRMA